MADEIQLDFYDLNRIITPFRIIIIGPSECGKTSLCCDILSRHTDIPTGIIMAGTDDANPVYDSFAPKVLTFNTYSEQHLVALNIAQEEKCYAKNAGIKDSTNRPVDTRSLVILDDLQHSADEWKRNQGIQQLATCGRNYDESTIIIMQGPKVLGPNIRTNFKHVFLYKPISQADIKRYQEEYCPQMSLSELSGVFRRLGKHECIVVDTTNPTSDIKTTCFWFKARPRTAIPAFKLFSAEVRNFCSHAFDPAYKFREIQNKKENVKNPKGKRQTIVFNKAYT